MSKESRSKMQRVDISTGYTPRAWQAEIHAALRRFNVLVIHRRGGKTILSINEAIDRGLNNPLKNPRYAYYAPFRDQAKKVAWDTGFKEYTKNLPGVTYNEAELRVDFHREDKGDVVRWQLFGAENPDASRGLYFDGVILDEYAQMDHTIWGEVVRPALSDRNGWAIFIGTPKGQNKFYDIFRHARTNMKIKGSEWFCSLKTVDDTKVISEKELESIKATMTKEEIQQEFYCNFNSSNRGAFYAHLIEQAEAKGKVTRVPHQKGHPVFTAWDLGMSDAMAIWFWQEVGNEIHVIDYYEDLEGGGMQAALTAITTDERSEYLYHTHFTPHDGAQRDMSGKTRVQDLIDLRRGRVEVLPRHSVFDGINEVRKVIPNCYFDEDRTEQGRERLKGYRKKWDRKREMFLADPLHDENSDGADAFRYLAMGRREEFGLGDDEEMVTVIDYDPLDMGA